jgi:hypothetical protein
MLILPLLLPIVLCTVALFFASFLSWMVFPFHRKDWTKMPHEEQVLNALRGARVPPGNYMIPGFDSPEEMNSAEFQAKQQAGPTGVVTIFSGMNMGRNLGLTMLFFFVTSLLLAYLARLGLPLGAEFGKVFRFVSTAALMTYLSAIVQHAIWFRCRIVGHVLESILYSAIAGAIFAALWPSG